MKRFILSVTFLFLLPCATIFAEIVTASTLHTAVRSGKKCTLGKKIKIILDENLMLSTLKKVCTKKNRLAQLILYSSQKKEFIIPKKMAARLRQILKVDAPIIVSGNAQLVIEEGATVVFNNNDIIITDNAALIFKATVL